jgi:hypothetical protein
VTIALQHVGTVAALRGDVRRGALLLWYADGQLRAEGFGREATEQRTFDIGLAALRSAAPPAALTELAARASGLSQDEAVLEARGVV